MYAQARYVELHCEEINKYIEKSQNEKAKLREVVAAQRENIVAMNSKLVSLSVCLLTFYTEYLFYVYRLNYSLGG